MQSSKRNSINSINSSIPELEMSYNSRSSSSLTGDAGGGLMPPPIDDNDANNNNSNTTSNATSSAAVAQDPETTPFSFGKESIVTDTGKKEEKQTRALILEAMKNSSLNPEERNLALQSILHKGSTKVVSASSEQFDIDQAGISGGENSAENDGDNVKDSVVGMFKKKRNKKREDNNILPTMDMSSESEPEDDVDDDDDVDEQDEDSEIIFESSTEEEEDEVNTKQLLVGTGSTTTAATKSWAVVKQSEAELEALLDLELQNQARLEEEQQRREAEFKVLRAMEVEKVRNERERKQRLMMLQQQQEDQRRVQEEMRRLREEQEVEGRRLMEERELQVWLERERTLRAREQQHHQQQQQQQQHLQNQHHEERQQMLSGTTQRQDGMVQTVGEVAQRGNVLSASQTLASRQGRSLNPSTAAGPTTVATLPTSRSVRNQPRPPTRYDGVDDDELNWRLDSYVSLSDFTIIVNRANPGPYSPDFATTDVSGIDFVVESTSGEGGTTTTTANTTTTAATPKRDVYYVHKAMIAVGSRRSEWLGRRIRDAENSSLTRGGGNPDGHSSEVNVHETVMLESAADAMSVVLDFCYYPDYPLEINVSNAVPLVYLGKRYKIRALLEQADYFVMENMVSTTAMHFLLDANLYHLDEILGRAIDVTAANLAVTVDFDPIYKLPPDLFRRIILSKEMQCDSELLSLIVYSYCGEHHAKDVDVEYFRELTKPRIMPDIDSKVALMVLKFYVDLILADDQDCDIMEVLQGDSLMNRCITVIAKNWKEEVCGSMIVDAEWENSTESARHQSSTPHQPAAIHRSLPSKLQNHLLEKCILGAKVEVDAEKSKIEKVGEFVKNVETELEKATEKQRQECNDYLIQIEQLHQKAADLEEQLDRKEKALEEYKQELKNFRRVPGIHNFGEVCKDDPKIIDKTKCTYSANPDHHYPLHRRGNSRPTQMPCKGEELKNLARENGYLYDDGKGELLPVFYYHKKSEGDDASSI